MNVKKTAALVVGGVTLAAANAHAAVDTALSGGVTDIGTFWDSIYDLKLVVAIAIIGIAWFKKLR